METREIYTAIACVINHSESPEAVEAFGAFANTVCRLPGVKLRALTRYGDDHTMKVLESINALNEAN